MSWRRLELICVLGACTQELPATVLGDEMARRLRGDEPFRGAVVLEAPWQHRPGGAAWQEAVAQRRDELRRCANLRPEEIVDEPGALPMLWLRTTPDRWLRVADCPGVLDVEVPPDMEPALQQTLPLIGASVVHQVDGLTGRGQNVVVIDTAVDVGVADLGACTAFGAPGCRVVLEVDSADNDNNANNGCWQHGTNVSSIVAGTAPGAGVVFHKVVTDTECQAAIGRAQAGQNPRPSFDAGAITRAFNWVVQNGAAWDVAAVNMSFGVPTTNPSIGAWTTPCNGTISGAYETALRAAANAGFLLVNSAGNEGSPGVGYPACLDEVLTVANSTNADVVAGSSNRGPLIEVSAPGTDVTAGGLTLSGTSMAAPHVAGAAAILRERDPAATSADLRRALSSSSSVASDPSPTAAVPTYPRLDVRDAVTALRPAPPSFPPADLSLEVFSWNLGQLPGEVWVSGHALATGPTAWADRSRFTAPVEGWVPELATAAVTVISAEDDDLYVGRETLGRDGIYLEDSESGARLALVGSAGRGDTADWWHVGSGGGDGRAETFAPEQPSTVSLSFSTFNLARGGDIELWVDGAWVPLPDIALDPRGDTMTLDLPGWVRRAGGHVVTFVATSSLDGWVSDITLADAAMSVRLGPDVPGPFDLGDTWWSAQGSWVHFGHTVGRPDLPWVSVFEIGAGGDLVLRFTPSGVDTARPARFIVNGAWLRIYDLPSVGGGEVEIPLGAAARSLAHLRLTVVPDVDPAISLAGVVVEHTGSGASRPLQAAALAGDLGDDVLVADPLFGGVGPRTWLAPGSDMRVVSRRVTLSPSSSQTVDLAPPSSEYTCTPFVNWEDIAEHPSPYCDVNATWAPVGGTTRFLLTAQGCGTGHPVGPAASARVTLFCFRQDAGWADTVAVDYDVRTLTPSVTTTTIPARWTGEALHLCSITQMDGNGDRDTGTSCRATELSPGVVQLDQTRGCQHDTKEVGTARLLSLAVPADVQAEVVPFTAGVAAIRHVYDPSFGPDHLAFVIPSDFDTSCDNHMTWRSSCTDDGAAVTCAVSKQGSIRAVRGRVLFLDGDFPESRELP